MSRGFHLRIISGPDTGQELVVTAAPAMPVVVGRSATLDAARDLRCTDHKVSRRHATIEAAAGGYLLTDRGSTNKTRHNGVILEPEVPVVLHDGDELGFGPDTVVQFALLPAGEPGSGEATVISTKPPAREPDRSDTPPAEWGSQPSQPTAAPPVPAMRPVPADAQPTEQFGRFAVYDELAQSRTDRVDVALDTSTDTWVALKRFPPRLLARKVQNRLLDDAARARRWQHPNIAEVVDAGVEGGIVYVASRFVLGVVLADVQDRYAREIDPLLAAYIAREACSALHYARGEERDFVHRNLSPRTIMLCPDGHVVLINFGLVDVKALLETTVKLTPAEARYLAPEHIHRRGLDPRSDIFSVGIVLYELLAHEPIELRRKAALPDVDTVRPEVPPVLADITTRAVALRPEDRYRSADEMEDELTAALNKLAPGYGSQVAEWMATRFPGLGARS